MGKVTDIVRDGIANIGGSMGLGDNAKPDLSGYAPSANENDFTQALLNQYNGKGTSAAQLQMQAGLDQSNANAVGLAASQRGVSPALAAQLAAQSQAQNQQQVNQQSGILRAQEQLGAGNTLANLFSSQRQSAGLGDQMQATIQANQQKNLLNSAGMGLSAAGMGGAQKKAFGGEIEGQEDAGGFVDLGGGDDGGGGFDPSQLAGLVAMLANKGAVVPGKAAVSGDSPQNDTVPAILSPKEIVLPRSVTMSKDAPEKARDFVAHIMSRKGEADKAKDRPKSYGEVLAKHRKLESRVKELESRLKG